jgi:Leucine Rich repeat
MNRPSRGHIALLLLGVLAAGCQRVPVKPSTARKTPDRVADKSIEEAALKARFEATGGIDPTDIAAWEKAGAKFGWLRFDGTGVWLFVTQRLPENHWFGTGPLFDSRPVPCFQCKKGLPEGIYSMPKPSVPFGLDFQHSPLGDADMQALGRFEQLRALMAGGTKVSNSGLAEVAKLPRLQILFLAGTQITDKGLAKLTALPALQGLDISNDGITDAGLREVARIEKLHILRLVRTKITDEGLKELTKLPHLDTLDLQDTKVSDLGMKELARCARLRCLKLLSRTDVTQAGVNELRKALPECQVEWYARVTD